MDELNTFLCGVLTVSCLFVGVFFIHYWRQTRDRFFLFLVVTFWALGVNWASLAGQRNEENEAFFYLPRLTAFVILLVGIADKNRRGRRASLGSRPD